MKGFSNFLLGLFGVSVLTLIGIAVAFYTVDPLKYRDTLIEAFNKQTGLNLEVKGDMKLKFHVLPEITLNDVRLHPSKVGPRFDLRAKTLNLSFGWRPFFKRELAVYELSITTGTLQFTTSKNKETSFVFDKLTGTLDLTRSAIALKGIKYSSYNGDIVGDLEFKFKKTPILTGSLLFKTLDFSDKSKLWSKEPIEWDVLNSIVLDLKVKIEHLLFIKKHLYDVSFDLKTKDGVLTVAPFKSKFAGGGLNGQITAQGGAVPKLKINFQGIGLLLGQLFDLPEHTFSGGRLRLDIQGEGGGRTGQAILQHFNGTGVVQMGASTIYNKKHLKTSEGFFLSIFSFLNPFQSRSPNTQVECLVVKASIKEGIAYFNPGIGIETRDANFLGSGKLNLGSGIVHVELGLDNKSPLSLQLGSFDNHLTISGPLSNPKYTLSSSNIVAESGSILAAVATAGLSLLAQKVLQETQKIRDPCGMVLRGMDLKPSDKRRKR